MGTHPIFESDFDCLTEFGYKNDGHSRPVCPSLRTKEDRNRRRPLPIGQGLIKVNGKPLEQIEPKALQYKLQEPVLVVGKERFAGIDIRVRVSGGGRIAQIYAIRQAVARAVVAYYQKYVDEQSKQEIKDLLIS